LGTLLFLTAIGKSVESLYAAAAAPLADDFHVEGLGGEGEHTAGELLLFVRLDDEVPDGTN